MKKLIFSLVIMSAFFACSNEPKTPNTVTEQAEQKAVEQQLEQDKLAMDSLEKAIEAQINATDSEQ